jgi:hypothetical protein
MEQLFIKSWALKRRCAAEAPKTDVLLLPCGFAGEHGAEPLTSLQEMYTVIKAKTAKDDETHSSSSCLAGTAISELKVDAFAVRTNSEDKDEVTVGGNIAEILCSTSHNEPGRHSSIHYPVLYSPRLLLLRDVPRWQSAEEADRQIPGPSRTSHQSDTSLTAPYIMRYDYQQHARSGSAYLQMLIGLCAGGFFVIHSLGQQQQAWNWFDGAGDCW